MMKRALAVLLSCALLLSGCTQSTNSPRSNEQETVNQETTAMNNEETAELKEKNITIPADELGDDTPYEYEVDFESLDSDELQQYVKDNLYQEIVSEIDSDQYLIENISTVYISQEYIDELIYNSQSNVYFGYTLEELDETFQGTRYIFTLGDDGETIVKPFEKYDDTYEQVIKNVAIGSGVILICVTVSVVSGGVGAPAVSMIFATAAKSGTVMALSSGALGGFVSGVITGLETKDMKQAVKAGSLAGSEGFKWGAIIGTATGGATETLALKGATLKGLTMNQAATIQKESGYPIELIKQFHTPEEYEVFKAAGLKPMMINGKIALVRSDIDLKLVDEFGRTNLRRMQLGLSPLDANGASMELHHIGQEADATLAILSQTEHDSAGLHGFKDISEIDRKLFEKQRKQFWKTMARMFESGEL